MAYGDFLGFCVDNYYICITQQSECVVGGQIIYCCFDDGNNSWYTTETCQFCPQNLLISYYSFPNYSESYYSDGTGSYYSSTSYCPYGYIFSTNESGIQFPNGCTYAVGTYNCIADGSGGRIINDIEYCVYGKIYYNETYSTSYIADGSGSYTLQVTQQLPTVSIKWQPSKDNINKLFCSIDACGNDLILSFSNSKNFYLINSICDTNIYINEAISNQTVTIDSIGRSFLYIKNNGISNLKINSSCSGTTGYWNYFESGQNQEITNLSGLNYLLRPSEELLFNFDVSVDGTKFLSKACIPFGYYYEFTNTCLLNPCGFYPVCCYNSTPTYFYQDICNYNSLDPRFRKLRSLNFQSQVDCCSNLKIDFLKFDNELVCLIRDVSGSSKMGNNQYDYNINLSCIEVFNEDSLLKTITNFENDYIELTIENDCNLYLNYHLNFDENKYKNYKYITCSNSGLSQQKLKKITSNSFEYLTVSGSSTIQENNLYNIKVEQQSCLFIDLNICNNSSIKDLKTFDYNRCNLYLPVLSEFDYCYSYELADANTTYSTGRFSGWVTGLEDDQSYINCSSLICCDCQEFIDNKPSIYKINFCNSESRYSSNNIQQKPINLSSEEFSLIFSNQEESIFYSGLEFKYFPAVSVVYNNTLYDIPNEYLDYCLCTSGKSTNLCFPVRALNYYNLKIISDYETVEKLTCSNLNFTYNGFNLNLTKTSNCISADVPVLRTENLSGYQHPSVSILNTHSSCVDSNLKFYINPVCNFYCDRAYELNNLFLFISSQLNNGIVTCTDFSGFQYRDSNYNFLLIDAEFEFKNCNFQIPTGCSYLFNSLTDSNDITYSELLPYKNITGNGYNYILPIQTGLRYTDCFFTGTGTLVCQTININASLNYLTTGRSYSGGAPQCIGLFDQSGVLTGSGYSTSENSSFLISKINSSFNLAEIDLENSISGRCIILEKFYTYSGIQPINITTNYGLLDVRNPLLCNDLKQYCDNISETCINNSFYYIYDINNPLQKPLKISSPEGTFINYIYWSDDKSDSNSICFACLNGTIGQIQSNASLINFSMKDLFYSNDFIYNCCKNKCICINIIGGL